MSFLANVKVGAKVGGGFGAVLVLLSVVAAVGFFGLSGADDNFDDYRESARQRNQANRVGIAVQRVRLNARNYMLEPSEPVARQTFDRIDLMQKEVDAAKQLMAGRKDLMAKVERIDAASRDWRRDFQELVAFQAEQDKQIAVLEKIGPEIEGSLADMIAKAATIDNTEAVARFGSIQRHLLLARVAAQRYLRTSADVSYQAAAGELATMARVIEETLPTLKVEENKATLGKIGELRKTYVAAWELAHKATKARDEMFKVKMKALGDEIVQQADEITGALREFQDALGPRAQAENQRSVTITVAISLVAIALGILAAWLIGTGISRPIVGMTDAMKRLAGGDKSVDIPGVGQQDEIGSMAQAVQVFKDNMIEAERLAAEQEKERKVREARAARIEQLTRDFDTAISEVLHLVSSAAAELHATAGSMSATAEQTTNQAGTVAAAAEEASSNVQTVAAATEELASSIQEISRQVAESTRIAVTAVDEARQTDEIVRGLADSAQKIGAVVALINDIASQTNLLALNATIEAARAGEAGKGFAVVANEVKSLANQTGKATEEIAQQVGSVQNATKQAVEAIQRIGATINRVSEIAATIASAVEEQGAATQEIARNVQQASIGTSEVTSNIAGVSQAAQETGHASHDVLNAATTLSRQSEGMKSTVDRFLGDVRSA